LTHDQFADSALTLPGVTGFDETRTGCRSAFVADAGFRRTQLGGVHVCMLLDALVERDPVRNSSWRFGHVPGPERVPSSLLALRPGIVDVLRACLLWTSNDLRDFIALRLLLGGFPKVMRCFPLLGMCRIPRWFWLLYAFCGVKLMSGPAARFASSFDEVFVVCYYNTRSLALVRAFRAQSKCVWDVQHGLLGPTHPAYANAGFWCRPTRLAPTGFLVWNSHARDFLAEVTRRSVVVRDFDDSFYFSGAPALRTDGRPCVLVTLQWGTSLPPQVVDMVARLADVRWVLRPHPRDPVPAGDREDCKRLSSLAHVEVSDPTEPLLALLYRCDLHITESSSVVIEAASIGRPSIVWDRSCAEAFESETRSGLARVATPGEVEELVRQALWPSVPAGAALHN
jgi:hypothetical protein